MISKEQIIDSVEEKISGTDDFLVDVKVQPDNKVFIEVDAPGSISVDECGRISRAMAEEFEEMGENVELHVSSPGLTQPFKVPEQYKKNVGKEVMIHTSDGEERKGELLEVMEDGVKLLRKTKERVEGKKKKIIVEREEGINFDNIKKTKVLISFK